MYNVIKSIYMKQGIPNSIPLNKELNHILNFAWKQLFLRKIEFEI